MIIHMGKYLSCMSTSLDCCNRYTSCAHIICSHLVFIFSCNVHYSVFEELSDEGKRIYRKRLAEFEEMYPEESKSSSPRPSKKAKLSSTTPKMKKNPKTLARVVSDVGSVGSPKSTAARRFVTPDATKHILPSPITRPDEPVSSMSYFDCLDIDLSDEAVHPLDTTEDFTDIFDLPVLEEGGDSSSSSNDMSMNMFPQLPFTSAATAPTHTGEEEAKKLYGYEVQPNPQVDDFLEMNFFPAWRSWLRDRDILACTNFTPS